LKLALIGYATRPARWRDCCGHKRAEFPFLVTGIHTLRHGTRSGA